MRILRCILGLLKHDESALSSALDLGAAVMRENAALRRQGRDAVSTADAYMAGELRKLADAARTNDHGGAGPGGG